MSKSQTLDPMLVLVHQMQVNCVYALTDKDARDKKLHVHQMLQAVDQARKVLVAELRYLEAVT